jgi:hypothetical protein
MKKIVQYLILMLLSAPALQAMETATQVEQKAKFDDAETEDLRLELLQRKIRGIREGELSNAEFIKDQIAHGADINNMNMNGESILNYLADLYYFPSDLDLFVISINAGANPFITNKNGLTPRQQLEAKQKKLAARRWVKYKPINLSPMIELLKKTEDAWAAKQTLSAYTSTESTCSSTLSSSSNTETESSRK